MLYAVAHIGYNCPVYQNMGVSFSTHHEEFSISCIGDAHMKVIEYTLYRSVVMQMKSDVLEASGKAIDYCANTSARILTEVLSSGMVLCFDRDVLLRFCGQYIRCSQQEG